MISERRIASLGIILIFTVLHVNGDCRRPTVFQNVTASFPSKGSRGQLPEYTMISFECKPGFQRRQGDKLITCSSGKWKVSENDKERNAINFMCEAKPCPVKQIENGHTDVIGGVHIKYSCNKGFRLQGFSRGQCRLNKDGDYFVVQKPPKCIPLQKCVDPKLQGLHYEGQCCFAGSNVTFTCPKNYQIEGTSQAICESSGNWSSPLPICKWIEKCRDPGNSSFSVRNGDCCEVGDTLTFTCDEGYELVDSEAGNSISCLPTEKWSGPKPKCKPLGAVICPDLPLEKNNLVLEESFSAKTGDVYMVWDEVSLRCKDGYKTSDDAMSLYCMETGEWDEKIPICISKGPCSRPPMPSNGEIMELVDNQAESFPIGFEINIECDKNYEIKSGHYGSRCLGDNVWENGIGNCTLIECSDPGIPEGAQRYGSDFQIGSTVTYKCIGNLQLLGSEKRTCQENRRWSGRTTVCDAGNTYCQDPGVPIHSHRKVEGFNMGDTVTYTCEPGHMMIGNDTIECLEDGTWSEEEITCLGPYEYSDADEVGEAMSKTVVQISRHSSYSVLTEGRSLSSGDSATGVNIFFLLDASGSITKQQFTKCKELAKLVIRQVGISPNIGGIRASVIYFTVEARTAVPWTVNSVEEAIRMIDGIQKGKDQGTNIAEALRHLKNEVATIKKNPQTQNSKNVAFIVTDGKENEGGKPDKVAEDLRHKLEVLMFAVAVGKDRNQETLRLITKDEKKIFDFDSHKKMYEVILAAIGDQTKYHLCGIDRIKYAEGKKDDKKNNRRKRFIYVGRIIGGKEAIYSWPWMAALYNKKHSKWSFACGGSIIHKDWILSAAHCFVHIDFRSNSIDNDETKNLQDPNLWKVSVGRLDLSDEKSGLEYFVSEIKLHKNYVPENYGNDIALLKLKYPIAYDIYTRPICLPPPMNEILPKNILYAPGKQPAFVIGWGHKEVKELNSTIPTKHTDKLNELMLPLQDDKKCKETVTYTRCQNAKCRTNSIKPSFNSLCAGTGKGGQDSCHGDSGGPLMQFVSSNSSGSIMNRWFEIGLVSWGPGGCGVKGYYGYYTHVSKLRQWILNETNAEFEDVSLIV